MRLVTLAAVVAVLVLPVASPASAATPPEDSTVLLKDSFTKKCLDSNASGAAYTSDCDATNGYQQWQWIPRGKGKVMLRDVATDRCLDANGGGNAYTNSCSVTNPYVQWQYREHSRTGALELKSVATGKCLIANINNEVFTTECRNLNYDWKPEAGTS